MPEHPFTTFNFRIELQYGEGGTAICDAEFSECDGLELNIEPKTFREGGNNRRPIHLVGPVSYGQLTLKRGMTTDFGLWEWFEAVQQTEGHGVRASGEIALRSEDGGSDRVRYALDGCLPIKLKVPSLSAKDGQIAIEEMQVVYESLTRKAAGGGGAAP
jgi:phage tail-like protein